jgi:tripartite-type tricarboxylate transporter receptor subunit TctC
MPGAEGRIGIRALKSLPADGYTLGWGTSSIMVVNPLLFKDLGYDPRDFIHVTGIAKGPTGFAVGEGSPYRSMREAFLAAAREKRSVNVGTYGAVSALGLQWLQVVTKQQIERVPYKGAGALVTDLIGGQLDMGAIDPTTVVELVKSGKLRFLALTSESHIPEYANVPLMRDFQPGYDISTWTSLIASRGTPPQILAQLLP